ncbi:MAG: signal peptidase I [Acidobacteria bacterium]|nr:signal peptidase I [Acidobacteriota bacterium]
MKLYTKILVALSPLAVLPNCLSALTVSGPSDAPTFVLGDKVLVNRAAYQFNFPYTNQSLFTTSLPRRGDMVLFFVPNRKTMGLKRIIGLPGDTIELKENTLYINGRLIDQTPLDRSLFAPWISAEHGLGTSLARESLGNWITYTPNRSTQRNTAAIRVPAGEYFLLGDHRDNSNDSRSFGTIPFRLIEGRVVKLLFSQRPANLYPGF